MKELINNIESVIKDREFTTSKVSFPLAESMYEELKQRFNLDYKQLYQWECYNEQKEVINYNQNWEALLKTKINILGDVVYIAVTDDEYYPWPLYKSNKNEIIELIADQPFFEYFFFDDKMNQIIFDTHHNTLITFR